MRQITRSMVSLMSLSAEFNSFFNQKAEELQGYINESYKSLWQFGFKLHEIKNDTETTFPSIKIKQLYLELDRRVKWQLSYDTFLKAIKTVDYINSNSIMTPQVKKIDFSKAQIIALSPVDNKEKLRLFDDLLNNRNMMDKYQKQVGVEYRNDPSISNAGLKSLLKTKQYQAEIKARKKNVKDIQISNLIHGVALDKLKGLNDSTVDCVIIDPPYAIEYTSFHKNHAQALHFTDELDWSEFDETIGQITRVMKPDSHFYCFCSAHNIDKFKEIIGKHLKFRTIIIWLKNNSAPTADFDFNYSSRYEMIVFATKGQRRFNFDHKPNRMHTNVMPFDIIQGQNRVHDAQKPLPLLQELILNSTVENETVLD